MCESVLLLDWLPNSSIVQIVSKSANLSPDEFQVLSTSINNASSEGENFVSHLLRLSVTISSSALHAAENHVLSFIIKLIDKNSRFGKFVDLDEVFDKEMHMYEVVLPALERIWETKAGEMIHFGPRCFLTIREPLKALVLEDLTEKGFEMQPKEQGLSIDQVRSILEKLANMHATSFIYLASNKLPDTFRFGLFDERYNSAWRHMQYDTLYSTLTEVISTLPGFEEEAGKIKSWKGNILTHVSNALDLREGEFRVLCHGDLWQNNVMFSSRERGDVVLFDFQFSCTKSPAQDLFYFLTYALREDDRVQNFDAMLDFYYEELEKSLDVLHVQQRLPTKRDYLADLNQRGFASSFSMVFHLMNLLQDFDAKLDMALALQDSKKGREYRKNLYESPRYLEAVKKFLRFLRGKGWLEVPSKS